MGSSNSTMGDNSTSTANSTANASSLTATASANNSMAGSMGVSDHENEHQYQKFKLTGCFRLRPCLSDVTGPIDRQLVYPHLVHGRCGLCDGRNPA